MDHLDPDRLESEALEPHEVAHLDGCPECRIDRRLLREPVTLDLGPDLVLARSALAEARHEGAATLGTSWATSRANARSTSTALDRDLLPAGARVGGYVVQTLLGQGGMAVVYGVRHAEHDTRHALKLLTAPGRSVQKRLLREGRLQGTVRHPNIVGVTDIVELDDAPGLVLELVRGPSVDRLIRMLGAPSLDEADALVTDVLCGMAAAHAAGLVHRDLKPSNILVDAETGAARVSDFGLAKVLFGQTDSLQTRTGGMLGTLMYMAPEQARDPRLADTRSDVFALGALVYEVLTGLRAFAGVDPVDILQRVSHGAYAPLPRRIPEGMRAFVGEALRLDPADRPADAGELLAAWTQRGDSAPPWAPERLELLDELHIEWPLPEAPLHAAVPRPFVGNATFPAERDAFVGRGDDLGRLATALRSHRLVTVLGPGGTGKTRLVTRFAHLRAHAWEGGAWFCDLSEAHTAEGVAFAVARTLDVQLRGADPMSQLGHALAARGRCLVVLDNAEQVAEATTDAVRAWLDRTAAAQIVVTSRVPLGLTVEAALSLDVLPDDAAERLFTERALAAKPDLVLDDPTPIRELVSLLDGLPLAIELAAARVRVMPPTAIRERMADRFRVLRSPGAGRHATLRATLDWSWELLSGDEQAGLAQLSVFAGGFTLQAAEAVLDVGDAWPEDVVQSLVEKSLVRASDYRFGLLRSVQAYAAEKLEDHAAEVRHGAHYAELGDGEALGRVWMVSGAEHRRAVYAEVENLVVACQRAVARGDGAVATATLQAATQVLAHQGPMATATDLGMRVAAIPGLPPAQRARVDATRARVTMMQGDMEAADALFGSAAKLAIEAGDARLEAVVRVYRADLVRHSGGAAEALPAMEDALAAVRAQGDRHMEGVALSHLAILHRRFRHLDRAREVNDQALAIHREVGNQRYEALSLSGAGIAHGLAGRVAEAETWFRKALVVAREAGDHGVVGSCLTHLATARSEQGDREEALALNREALQLERHLGARLASAVTLRHLADDLRQLGRVDEARAHLEEALEIQRARAAPGHEAASALTLGRLEHGVGDLDAADRSLRRALELEEQWGPPAAVTDVLRALTLVWIDAGDLDEAQALAERALHTDRDHDQVRNQGFDLQLLARIAMARGDHDRAEAHYTEAIARMREAGDDAAVAELEQALTTGRREG